MVDLLGSCCVIRAAFSDETVRIYQAYCPEIAKPALDAGRFVPPFNMSRMTWIKTSFNWMMYRSGFAGKPGQEVVLGIDITRSGFEWALEHAVLSHYHAGIHSSQAEWQSSVRHAPVRVQWDPERNWRSNPVKDVRAIQIGLSGEAITRYVNEWIVCMENVTHTAHRIASALKGGVVPDDLPERLEQPYPLSSGLRLKLSQTILPP